VSAQRDGLVGGAYDGLTIALTAIQRLYDDPPSGLPDGSESAPSPEFVDGYTDALNDIEGWITSRGEEHGVAILGRIAQLRDGLVATDG
jgi:hypothetical protein